MNPVHSKTFTVSAYDADRFQRLKPSRLLGFMQEAAGDHSTLLGAGKDALCEKALFWAVLRHKLQITRLPSVGESVTVETWPMPTTRSAYPRSAIGYDRSGNELFRGISLWGLMSADARSLVLPGKSGVIVNGILRGNELAVPGSQAPLALKNQLSRQVQFTELDENGHMNNCRYLDWASDLLPSQFHENHPLQGFSVRYLSEAKEREILNLSWELTQDGGLLLEGARSPSVDAGYHRVFSLQLEF